MFGLKTLAAEEATRLTILGFCVMTSGCSSRNVLKLCLNKATCSAIDDASLAFDGGNLDASKPASDNVLFNKLSLDDALDEDPECAAGGLFKDLLCKLFECFSNSSKNSVCLRFSVARKLDSDLSGLSVCFSSIIFLACKFKAKASIRLPIFLPPFFNTGALGFSSNTGFWLLPGELPLVRFTGAAELRSRTSAPKTVSFGFGL